VAVAPEPVEVKLTDCPKQIEDDEMPAVTVVAGLTITVVLPALVQPLTSVTVTV
jgi:hypothetical protein